jgi:glycosyltransferase involved in cell wall biosynthesis
VQTYARELIAALPDAWPDASFVARVAPGAAPLVDGRVATSALRMPFDHGLARRVRSTIPVRGFDVVHGLDTDAPLAGSAAVVTVHDLGLFDVPDAFDRVRGRAKRALVAASIRRADAIVSVSAFTAERVRARFGRDSTVVLEAPSRAMVPPAEGPEDAPDDATGDATVGAVRSRYALPARFVLHVGNLEGRKDVATLAAACRAADVPLVLAGGAISTVAVPVGVHPIGYVPDADLPALYRAATVVAYVSRYEGFALPPVEAMACGAVVMTTAVGAIPEIVGAIAGEGAEVVPIGDVDAQAGALRDLFADEARRAERRVHALAAVRALSWERAARETAAVYRRVL